MLHRLLPAAIVAALFSPVALAAETSSPPAEAAPWAPTSAYTPRSIEGWNVLVLSAFERDESGCAASVLQLLQSQLFLITRAVPAEPLAQLRQVTIWVERDEPHHPCMVYHPSPDWLHAHGMNPEKGGCVEIANARNFLDWCRTQPWMVFHELAHAYHDRFLPGGYDHQELRDAYQAAVDSGKYQSVLHIAGRHERAYALTNPQEYFAETSECFFGTNDFYPFVRAELREHDPAGAAMLAKLWRVVE